MNRPPGKAYKVASKSTAVGAFVLGAIALGVGAVLLFGGTRLLEKNLRVVVYFQDSVAGLSVGAPVTLRGVKVGTVRSMKVYLKLPELVPVIPVYLEIDPKQVSWSKGAAEAAEVDLQQAIKAGLRAQLATQSLVTGQLSVNLDFYTQQEVNPSVHNEGDTVPEIPSIASDLQKIKDDIADLKLPELAEKARIALTSIEKIVGELSGTLGPLAESLKQTSDAARGTLQTATAAVEEVQRDASRTLNSIDKLSITASTLVETSGKEITLVLTTANHAATQAEKLIGAVNDLIAPRAQVRSDLEAAMRDLAASASSLRNFARDLERNPAGTILGKSR